MAMRVTTTSGRQSVARQLEETIAFEEDEYLIVEAPIRLHRPYADSPLAVLRSLVETSSRGHLLLTDRRLALLRVRATKPNVVYDIPRSLIRAVEPAGGGYLRLVCDAPDLPADMTGIKAGLGAAASGVAGGLMGAGPTGQAIGGAGAEGARSRRGDELAVVLLEELNGPDEAAILRVLDAGCRAHVFPMLDNGYVYLAATRLSLHRSAADWALVFEIFGHSPRGLAPDLGIWSFGSRLVGRKTPDDYVNEEAYRTYRRVHAHDDAEFFFPVDGDWQDPDEAEMVALDADVVTVRGKDIPIPGRDSFALHGIELVEPDRMRAFEVCRYLADIERDLVLATPEERRTHVPPELEEILVLDEWHHPDTVTGEVASQTASFRSIARVLATGDVDAYDASEPGNTHWSNWPDGGTL